MRSCSVIQLWRDDLLSLSRRLEYYGEYYYISEHKTMAVGGWDWRPKCPSRAAMCWGRSEIRSSSISAVDNRYL
jgi:hypothetical protein